MDHQINKLATGLVSLCTERSLKIATAESCTGGLIAAALTDVAGSSAVVDRGFVTYSNEAKAEMLNVPMPTIVVNGAVSEQVAAAMVLGALENSDAKLAVSVTGIAGPGGGTAAKPVGLVYIAAQLQGQTAVVKKCLFADEGYSTRTEVRNATVARALEMMLDQIS